MSLVAGQGAAVHGRTAAPSRVPAAWPRGRTGGLALGVLLALVTTVLLWPQFQAPGWVQDEAILLVYPQRMLQGAVPQRDFQALYGPGTFWLLALAYRLAGLTVTVERAVGLGLRLAIVLAMYATARRWGVLPGLLAGLIAALSFPQLGLAAFAWLAALAPALWGLWLLREASLDPAASPRRWGLASLLLGLALLSRPDLVVALALPSLVFLAGASWGARRWFLGGGALGVAPFLAQLALAGPGAVWRNLVTDAVFRIHDGRKLPLPTGWGLASVEFHLLFVAAAWLLLLAALARRRQERDCGCRPARVYLAHGLFSLALLSQPLQRADATHVNLVGCVVLALLPVAAAGSLKLLGSARALRASASLLVGLAVLAGQWSLAGPYRHPTSAPAGIAGRSFPVVNRDQALTIDRMLVDLRRQARPGDRLFVGPADLSRTPLNDTYLYYLLPDLTPATYFLEMNPGSANAPGTRLAADLRTADFVILDEVYLYWGEPNTANQPGSTAANDVLHALFCPAGDYGPFHLYSRCRA